MRQALGGLVRTGRGLVAFITNYKAELKEAILEEVQEKLDLEEINLGD